MVETKGYEFHWEVAVDGYELVDETLCEYRGSIAGFEFERYDPDYIFFVLELCTKRFFGELKPTFIDVLAPWLVLKGTQSHLRDSELEKPKEVLNGTRISQKRVYEPLSDHPGLHRKFASLRTEDLETQCLEFAKKYGLLGQVFHLSPVSFDGKRVIGESLYRWRAEIEKMGVLLAIWDWVRKRDAGKLGQIVIWPDCDHVVVKFNWRSEKGKYEILPCDTSESRNCAYVEEELASRSVNDYSADGTHAQWFFEQYKRGDVVGPASYYLCRMLNYHIQGIAPQLVAELGYKVAYVPETLLAALWLMFMLEVNGVTRACWHCGETFELSRKDNVYCSSNCRRMAHYYNRQRLGEIHEGPH